MDSITQATLGAAVAHVCWHRKLGRSALLWGAVLGTLPDLDILVYPFLDTMQRLYWHRGESHSVFFSVLGGLLFGWLLWKYRWKNELSFRLAALGVILVFITHIILDYFTIYGTQLLAPFSRHGFANGNLFIIDPLYTIPLLAGVIAAAVSEKPIGWKANMTGVIVSCLYVSFSYVSHAYADQTFKRQLASQNVEVLESFTSATPFNTKLWRHVARTPEGMVIGYFSVIADNPDTPIRFDRVSRNEHLIAPYRDHRSVKTVEWFSKGFWVAREDNNMLTLSDLRFGELRLNENDGPDKWRYIFTWEITDDPNTFNKQRPEVTGVRTALTSIWNRLIGSYS